jgi:hypothetical protein
VICNFCGVGFDDRNERDQTTLREQDGLSSRITHWRCPSCFELILAFERIRLSNMEPRAPRVKLTMIYPMTGGRLPAPTEVRTFDRSLANDYDEACAVLDRSPKAAAALGRRCIQHMIRTQLEITKPTLHAEIEEVRARKALPEKLLRQLDAGRHIGNNAAHPNVDQAGLILPVTSDEAVWTLDVVALMFNELFLEPVQEHARASALAQKTGKTIPLPKLPTKVEGGEVDADEASDEETATSQA